MEGGMSREEFLLALAGLIVVFVARLIPLVILWLKLRIAMLRRGNR